MRFKLFMFGLILLVLLMGGFELNAGWIKSKDFLVKLEQVEVEAKEPGKRTFRFNARVEYVGKNPIRLTAGENVFISKDAGFLQRSIYFATNPVIKSCSMRQTMMGINIETLKHTFQPGEVLEEEWNHSGQDLNSAKHNGPINDGGICLKEAGLYRIQAILGTWTEKSDFLYAVGNEQEVNIP